MRFIRSLNDVDRDDVDVAGGKGANLGELIAAGLPVPPGVVVLTSAYRQFVTSSGMEPELLDHASLPPDADPDAFEQASVRIRGMFRTAAIPQEIAAELLDAGTRLGEGALAVRSSATAEDLAAASFAGQQDTFLDVHGGAALVTAVKDCWASLWTARAMTYRARRRIDPADVALAVVVQRMIDADASGVMFTVNPTTGHRDEIVISAAWGLGESVVGGSVNTDDLVVAKVTGQVQSRTTADKVVMTVGSGQGTAEVPVPGERRTLAVLTDAEAARLAALGARIESHFGAPQDVEWARQGGQGGDFWIVQSRPVTGLPEPEAEPPTDWSVPDPRAYYMRASIVEQLPDPLSTLFADLVDASVTRSLAGLMRDLSRREVLQEGDVGLPTVNGYAYYRYSRSGLWRMTLLSPAAIRLFRSRDPVGGPAYWRDHARPRYREAVDRWTARPTTQLTDAELMEGVARLLDAGTEYYTAVQTIIPQATTSELTFTWFYDRVVRRAADPPASTFLLGFDSLPIAAEKSLYDLAARAREHVQLADALLTTPTARLSGLLGGDDVPAGVDAGVWRQWRTLFHDHVDRYGHTVYNLDFLNPVPADDPAPLIDTIRHHLGGRLTDPHERQRRLVDRREAATQAVLGRLDPVRRRAFARLLHWAQSLGPIREDSLADLGLAWPQLRRLLHELGVRLVASGVIDVPDDVCWLRRDEILGKTHTRLADEVERRKAVWRGQRRVTPPQFLPVGTWWERFEKFMPATSADHQGGVLTGSGASAGHVTGPARVLVSVHDFGRMQPGDVLVAAITTPAWTPLFAMASAVVTDIGGPLSHSSIVAREYGIPAVLGTGVATRRIPDGSLVRVDGDAGTVSILDHARSEAGTQEAEPLQGDQAAPSRRTRRAVATGALGALVVLLLARKRHRLAS